MGASCLCRTAPLNSAGPLPCVINKSLLNLGLSVTTVTKYTCILLCRNNIDYVFNQFMCFFVQCPFVPFSEPGPLSKFNAIKPKDKQEPENKTFLDQTVSITSGETTQLSWSSTCKKEWVRLAGISLYASSGAANKMHTVSSWFYLRTKPIILFHPFLMRYGHATPTGFFPVSSKG